MRSTHPRLVLLALAVAVAAACTSSLSPPPPNTLMAVRVPFMCHMSPSSPSLEVYLLPNGLPSPTWQVTAQPLVLKSLIELPTFQIIAHLSS